MSNHQLHSQSLFILSSSLVLYHTHLQLPTDTHLETHGDTWRHMVTCTHSHTHTWVQMSGTFVYQSCQQLLQHGNYPETRLSFWSTHQHHTHTHTSKRRLSPPYMLLICFRYNVKRSFPLSTLLSLFIHFSPTSSLCEIYFVLCGQFSLRPVTY